MKLKTVEIIALFQALSELKGKPTVVPQANGQVAVVHEPYDLGPKFTWNAAKNRAILRRHVEAHDEQVMDFSLKLRASKRKMAAAKDSPKEQQEQLQREIDDANTELRKLAQDTFDVEGLLKLPASGLNLKTSGIPPTLIEELMPLIEGEPDLGDEAKK
jgi:hypothetical protein